MIRISFVTLHKNLKNTYAASFIIRVKMSCIISTKQIYFTIYKIKLITVCICVHVRLLVCMYDIVCIYVFVCVCCVWSYIASYTCLSFTYIIYIYRYKNFTMNARIQQLTIDKDCYVSTTIHHFIPSFYTFCCTILLDINTA